jgi:hypothetical protein
MLSLMKNHKGPPIKYVFCIKKIKKRKKREKKEEKKREKIEFLLKE